MSIRSSGCCGGGVLGRKEGKEETRRRGLVVVFPSFIRKSLLLQKKERSVVRVVWSL